LALPRSQEELDKHASSCSAARRRLAAAERKLAAALGHDGNGAPRVPWLTITMCLVLRLPARIGIAMLPDYLVEENGGLVQCSRQQ